MEKFNILMLLACGLHVVMHENRYLVCGCRCGLVLSPIFAGPEMIVAFALVRGDIGIDPILNFTLILSRRLLRPELRFNEAFDW